MATALQSNKQRKRKRERGIKQEGAADSLATTDANIVTSHGAQAKQALKWKKKRRKTSRFVVGEDPTARQQDDAHQQASSRTDSIRKQLQPGDATTNVFEAKQLSKWKKKRKKKRHLAVEEEPVARRDTNQYTPHVGIDQINSNWKQLQAKLMKGPARWKNQDRVHKEQTVGVGVIKLGKFQIKDVEDATQRPLEMLSPKNEDCSLTKVLAMDCEMVGAGMDGKRSILARVSLVNMWGNVVYDKHIRPKEQVTDYRTNISGVRASNLRKGEDFTIVQKEVVELILGRVLVGHSLQNDLKMMYLIHPKKDIRDTAAYLPLRNPNGRPRALRHIAEELLGVKIQVGEHCSVQDARAAMYIYQRLKREWEGTMSRRHKLNHVKEA